MRAIRARYNPYLQTRHRMDQVKSYFFFVFFQPRNQFKKVTAETIHKNVNVTDVHNNKAYGMLIFDFYSLQLKQLGHSVDKVR